MSSVTAVPETSQAPARAMLQTWLDSWRAATSWRGLFPDIAAGVTVAAVALPLNLALAVASGLPPAAGLIAGAVGGGLAAIFGGAPLQVTGPAAALNTLVFALVADFGAAGAAGAALAVGGLQIVLGLARAGRLARFVPETVLVGFTTGVGLKLLDGQLPELLGFDYRVVELLQMMHRPEWLHEVRWLAVLCGLGVAFGVVALQSFRRFPAALAGVALMTALSAYLGWDLERVGEIPSRLHFVGIPTLESGQWPALLLRVLPLAVLASAESLLSARAIDRLAHTQIAHSPDLELLGQGVANLGSGLVGAMPVTGVIVRSSVGVQSGARTRRSALVHALALLVVILFLGAKLAEIPLAALAGLLCVVGVRLIEFQAVPRLWKEQRLQAVAFVATALGTVAGHLMSALTAGIVLSALGTWLGRRGTLARQDEALRRRAGIRAVVEFAEAEAHEGHPAPGSQVRNWLTNIRAPGQRAHSAFVHAQASVVGRVLLGEHVHIAAGCAVRADEGTPFYIGANSNLQDGVVVHALQEGRVLVGENAWAVYIGRDVSVAHQALIHGPCYVGEGSFVGFKATVHDAVIGARCYIGIGAVVVGVEIPAGRYVPHGAVVDTPEKVLELAAVSGTQLRFNEAVVNVNSGLAAAYQKHHGLTPEDALERERADGGA